MIHTLISFFVQVFSREAVSKVIDAVILNLFRDRNALYIRSRNEFGMTDAFIEKLRLPAFLFQSRGSQNRWSGMSSF